MAFYENGVVQGDQVSIVENLTGGIQSYKFSYSFAIDGGAVSTIVLRQSQGPIPNGLMILQAVLNVTTELASAGAATAALATPQSAGDLVPTTAFDAAPWDVVAVGELNILGLVTTQARSPTLTIAGAALTGGVFNLYIQGVLA